MCVSPRRPTSRDKQHSATAEWWAGSEKDNYGNAAGNIIAIMKIYFVQLNDKIENVLGGAPK
jgi:hypothetical protein